MSRDFSKASRHYIEYGVSIDTSGQLTCAGWFDIDSVDNSGSEMISVDGCLVLRHNPAGIVDLQTYIYDGSWRYKASNVSIIGSGWSFVAAGHDASKRPWVFVNGTRYTGTAGSALSANDSKVWLGRHYGGNTTYDYDGRMRDVAVWERELTDREMIALENGFTADMFQDGLVFHAPLIREVDDRFKATENNDTSTYSSSDPNLIQAPTWGNHFRMTPTGVGGAAPAVTYFPGIFMPF